MDDDGGRTWVRGLAEAGEPRADLLGSKGAGLAGMTRLGLPVPPGFTLTTDVCRHHLEHGTTPPGLADALTAHLAALEEATGRTLGDPADPLLLAVRSGAAASMPGMMETVLDVGLTDASVQGLAARSGDDRFAWDCYRRLVQTFGRTVLGVDRERFEEVLDEAGREQGTDLDAGRLRDVVGRFRAVVRAHAGRDLPQDPREQLDLAIDAVLRSWNSPRAVLYRRREGIPDDAGTAVTVCAMVFGNLGTDSGTGVASSRDPRTGARGVHGEYLPDAQGEDVVSGVRDPRPLADLRRIDRRVHDELVRAVTLLEAHTRDLCEVEFTVERGRLWLLQTRVGTRSAAAAFVVATQLVDEGLVDLDEAVRRVTGDQLARLASPRFVPAGGARLLARGLGASPGAAVGRAVFSARTAVERAGRGEAVVLVRRETDPGDLAGMIAARGVLTGRGGATSHAAVVARGMGRPCVCGAEELRVDTGNRRFTAPDGTVVAEGDVVSIDGSTGRVWLGEVAVEDSAVARYLAGELDPGSPDADDVVRSVHRILARRPDLRGEESGS